MANAPAWTSIAALSAMLVIGGKIQLAKKPSYTLIILGRICHLLFHNITRDPPKSYQCAFLASVKLAADYFLPHISSSAADLTEPYNAKLKYCVYISQFFQILSLFGSTPLTSHNPISSAAELKY
jgi:hypothetical protein